jgi:hypothetical protein
MAKEAIKINHPKFGSVFYADLYAFHPAKDGNFIVRGYHYVIGDPWVGFILIMCFVHMTWVYILLLVQLFQVSKQYVPVGP